MGLITGSMHVLLLFFPNVCCLKGSADDYQRRCAVLQCQLKKVELSKRAYEVSTEKLLKFAQVTCLIL